MSKKFLVHERVMFISDWPLECAPCALKGHSLKEVRISWTAYNKMTAEEFREFSTMIAMPSLLFLNGSIIIG